MYSQWVEPSDDDLRAAVASMVVGAEDNAASVRILSSSSEPGSAVGDGLTSVLRAISVQFQIDGGEKRESRMMGKMFPVGADMSQSWDSMKFFERETEFYGRLRGVLDEAAAKLGESPLPFPKVYRCREGEKVFLMEDLKVSGFQLNDAHDKLRKSALNQEEMGLTLRELARVHAVSYHALQTYPGGVEAFARDYPFVEQGGRNGMYQTLQPDIVLKNDQLYQPMLEKAATAASADVAADIISRFRAFIPNASQRCSPSRNPDGGKLLVIGHGDLWSPNLMFRRAESDGDLELRMIDFQECMLTRPNADLACLVLNSVLPEDREEHLQAWMKLYHDELMRLLLKFGHDCREMYNLEDLWQDYRNGIGHGFMWGVCNAVGVLSTKSLASSVSGGTDSEPAELQQREHYSEAQGVAHQRIVSLIKEGAEYGLF